MIESVRCRRLGFTSSLIQTARFATIRGGDVISAAVAGAGESLNNLGLGGSWRWSSRRSRAPPAPFGSPVPPKQAGGQPLARVPGTQRRATVRTLGG